MRGGVEIDHSKLQLRQREIDYTPIAGPPGEFGELSLLVKSVHDFGALRQIRA